MSLKQPQKHQISHQLIVNYNPQLCTSLYSYFPSKLWTQSWNFVQNESYKYISQSSNVFPYNEMLNRLRRAIITHSNFEIYPQVRKQMIRIFYTIFNNFVEIWAGNKQIQQQQQVMEISYKNYFQKFIGYYKRISPRIKRLESVLAIVLSKHTTSKQIRKQINHIISKQMMNCSVYENFVNQCLELIDNYRDKNFSNQSDYSDEQQFMNKIQLLIDTQTFPYSQYMERSKKYFTQLQPKIPKNIEMFDIMHNFIENQYKLSKIIVTDVEKVRKSQSWRISKLEQKQEILRIFCKEVLDDVYSDMVEYLDYLLADSQQCEKVFMPTSFIPDNPKPDRIKLLKYLWIFTKILKRYKHESEQKLLARFSEIVKDNQKYIDHPSQLYKIATQRQNLTELMVKCFDESPRFINELNNGIEYVLMENQTQFNSKLCEIILSPNYRFPLQTQMQEEVQNQNLNNRYSQELFKLTPSKEHFIRKFQQQFSRYVISVTNSELLPLNQQQNFIKTIQRQCGYMLSKTIQKMLSDVWRDNNHQYYGIGIMKCRILSPEWPQFIGSSCRLVDQLLDLQNQFQKKFESIGDGQNQKKTLKWVWQYGTIVMNVLGVQSTFSEIQASIVILLERSFRPIRSKQFSQILQFPEKQIQPILQQLYSKNIITYDEEGKYYQLNTSNTVGFNFKINQKSVTNKQKKTLERDYGIIVEAYITRILKKRKSVQKTDLLKLLSNELKTHTPSLQELSHAIQKLCARDIITVEKTRGILRYIE